MKPDIKYIEDVVSSILPKNITRAIYIFGSYTTEFFNNDSDIDIGWFTTDSSIEDDYLYEEALSRKLNRKVDLVIVTEATKIFLLGNILSGIPIGYMSKEFEDWFDRNIYSIEKDMEDILEMMWRRKYNYALK